MVKLLLALQNLANITFGSPVSIWDIILANKQMSHVLNVSKILAPNKEMRTRHCLRFAFCSTHSALRKFRAEILSIRTWLLNGFFGQSSRPGSQIDMSILSTLWL